MIQLCRSVYIKTTGTMRQHGRVVPKDDPQAGCRWVPLGAGAFRHRCCARACRHACEVVTTVPVLVVLSSLSFAIARLQTLGHARVLVPTQRHQGRARDAPPPPPNLHPRGPHQITSSPGLELEAIHAFVCWRTIRVRSVMCAAMACVVAHGRGAGSLQSQSDGILAVCDVTVMWKCLEDAASTHSTHLFPRP